MRVDPCNRGENGTPCGRATTGPMTPDQCPRCWINLTGGRPKSKTVPDPPPVVATKSILDCPCRGAPTGETVSCKTCRGNVLFKVFACEKHGRCVLGKAAGGVHLCDAYAVR